MNDTSAGEVAVRLIDGDTCFPSSLTLVEALGRGLQRGPAMITGVDNGGSRRRWAAADVVIAVVCGLIAAGLLLLVLSWLGWTGSWGLGLLAAKGVVKVAMLVSAGLAAGVAWLRQRRRGTDES
ncbi:hypothetical protein [Kitasatospora sp. McL0602]|uniref:hypothetical protein n=1 Tax=Kitasatospora sp. McL0602 TaxID=3439530 RepID=UPI003F8AF559